MIKFDIGFQIKVNRTIDGCHAHVIYLQVLNLLSILVLKIGEFIAYLYEHYINLTLLNVDS